jgi:hypothetical protein
MKVGLLNGDRRIVWVLGLAIAGALPGVAQQPLAEPFTPAARWSQYLHRTYDPSRLGFLAVDTAFDNLLREPACWDSGAHSYVRRYGRAMERRVIRNTTELVTGLLTGEDLRYRPSQSSSVTGRAWNAVRSSVLARMPDGASRPAYTRFFAAAVTSVSTAHWTRERMGPERLARSVGWCTLDQIETNLLSEFGPDLRRIGMRAWKRIRRIP